MVVDLNSVFNSIVAYHVRAIGARLPLFGARQARYTVQPVLTLSKRHLLRRTSVRAEASLRELLADGLQFLPALRAHFGVGHLESFERIQDDLRYDQPGVR